jgi:membrane protease YdiL (CAAX protease family)
MPYTLSVFDQPLRDTPPRTPVAGGQIGRSLAALALGLVPPYSFAVFVRATQGRLFSLHEMILYPLVVGGAGLAVILALHRFVCGRPLSALNERPGSWRRDWPTGLALAGLFVAFSFAAQPVLARLVAPPRNPEAMTLIVGLIEHPLLMLVWFGPVLWVGIAAFEEVSRVFVITRLTAIRAGWSGRLAAIVISTVLFGLAHYYQGPFGVITTGTMGLLSAVLYVRQGRIWPLIVGHALYDAWSVGMAVVMVGGST